MDVEFTTSANRVSADDVSGLPENLAEAILEVEAASWDIHERVQLAEQAYELYPDDPRSLPPDHAQTSWASRFEVVDGEVFEILKESALTPVTVTRRPDLRVGEDADPLSALDARLQVPADPVETEEEQA